MGRVHGQVLVTRAFGDSSCKITNESKWLEYKTLLITPEVREHIIDPFKDEFIVIASDGLYDTMKSQEIIDFVRERYDNTPELIANELLAEAVENRDAKDDITIILILLQRHLR